MKKTIVIYSESNDASTNYVIDWLKGSDFNVVRVNGIEDLVSNDFSFDLQEESELFIGSTKHVDSIFSVWYRRETIGDYKDLFKSLETSLSNQTWIYLKSELESFNAISFEKIPAEKKLCTHSDLHLSKVKVLSEAKDLGIDIPATIITSCKQRLLRFIQKHGMVITKPITDVPGFMVENEKGKDWFIMYTELVNDLERVPDSFFPSLFQEQLDKEIEIRSFYLEGNFYSMAIFSQLDEQTNVDFRMYNAAKENRTVPYKLPSEIEEKLSKLMQRLRLNTGSIDIVKTKCGRFAFLEVNPWGQYDMVSEPCNYYLDEKIANYLSNYE